MRKLYPKRYVCNGRKNALLGVFGIRKHATFKPRLLLAVGGITGTAHSVPSPGVPVIISRTFVHEVSRQYKIHTRKRRGIIFKNRAYPFELFFFKLLLT